MVTHIKRFKTDNTQNEGRPSLSQSIPPNPLIKEFASLPYELAVSQATSIIRSLTIQAAKTKRLKRTRGTLVEISTCWMISLRARWRGNLPKLH
ncbi:hypothetical protein EVAR_19838_1 [Eumeta japonica]|uniref:Uncharacterized protein n=1 Tax=Eumeta variegata TaxID=151549 RepID=A0A4C1USK8_EUMVA|nr:hypothetical protein EVAR_19838_1 [Eumeta japonica]